MNTKHIGKTVATLLMAAALLFGGNSLFGGQDSGNTGSYSTPAPTVITRSPSETLRRIWFSISSK